MIPSCKFLRFESEEVGTKFLSDIFGLNDNGELLTYNEHIGVLSIIGTVYKPTGVTFEDEYGVERDETAPVNGWHVNALMYINHSKINEFSVHVDNPCEVFAIK